jgi:hypothetical protein
MYITVLNKCFLCFLRVRRMRCGQLLALLLWEITDRFCTREALWTVFAAMALGSGPDLPAKQ